MAEEEKSLAKGKHKHTVRPLDVVIVHGTARNGATVLHLMVDIFTVHCTENDLCGVYVGRNLAVARRQGKRQPIALTAPPIGCCLGGILCRKKGRRKKNRSVTLSGRIGNVPCHVRLSFLSLQPRRPFVVVSAVCRGPAGTRCIERRPGELVLKSGKDAKCVYWKEKKKVNCI